MPDFERDTSVYIGEYETTVNTYISPTDFLEECSFEERRETATELGSAFPDEFYGDFDGWSAFQHHFVRHFLEDAEQEQVDAYLRIMKIYCEGADLEWSVPVRAPRITVQNTQREPPLPTELDPEVIPQVGVLNWYYTISQLPLDEFTALPDMIKHDLREKLAAAEEHTAAA